MKIQDILFLVVLIFLIFKKDSRLSLYAGVGSILLSIPLFYLQIFFTAEHLIWYSAGFLVLTLALTVFKEKLI